MAKVMSKEIAALVAALAAQDQRAAEKKKAVLEVKAASIFDWLVGLPLEKYDLGTRVTVIKVTTPTPAWLKTPMRLAMESGRAVVCPTGRKSPVAGRSSPIRPPALAAIPEVQPPAAPAVILRRVDAVAAAGIAAPAVAENADADAENADADADTEFAAIALTDDDELPQVEAAPSVGQKRRAPLPRRDARQRVSRSRAPPPRLSDEIPAADVPTGKAAAKAKIKAAEQVLLVLVYGSVLLAWYCISTVLVQLYCIRCPMHSCTPWGAPQAWWHV